MRVVSKTDDEVVFGCPSCDRSLIFPRCGSWTKRGERCGLAALTGSLCQVHQRTGARPPGYSAARERAETRREIRERKIALVRELLAQGRTVRAVCAEARVSPNLVVSLR